MTKKDTKKEDSKERANIGNEFGVEVLENQPCPFCKKNTLTLTEAERDIPYFGRVYVFSMTCSSCKAHKADVECVEKHEPMRYTLVVESEEDLKARVVKSSEATVKIPHVTTISPGPASQGYVTNIEGILMRVKRILEGAKESAEDDKERKKAKNLLKKINKVLASQETIKVIVEDKTGNSAIVSDKAIKQRIR